MSFDSRAARDLLRAYAPGFARPCEIEALEAALEQIDSQARRIEALRAGWIEERMRYVLLFPEMWNRKDRKEAILDARQQLAAEHPDLFGGVQS